MHGNTNIKYMYFTYTEIYNNVKVLRKKKLLYCSIILWKYEFSVTADVDCELQFVSWHNRFAQANDDHVLKVLNTAFSKHVTAVL